MVTPEQWASDIGHGRAVGDRLHVKYAMSYDDRRRLIEVALGKKYPANSPTDLAQPYAYTYIKEMYDDYIIFDRNSKCYRAEYTISDDKGSATIGPAVEVKAVYIPVV